MTGPWEKRPVTALEQGGVKREERAVVAEVPLALTFNRIPYVVMMVTPEHLEDFVRGFIVTEGLVARGQAPAVEIAPAEGGWIAHVEVDSKVLKRVLKRRRNLVGQTSCGLCGLEDLSEVLRELPAAKAPDEVTAGAIFKALDELEPMQEINLATGAAHAAALVGTDGAIRIVREDAGRHSALDKLVGAAAAAGEHISGGFVLLTSRCSYELVQKALAAGVRLLVTISAPTGLAVELAEKYSLSVISLARPDRMLVFSDPFNRFGGVTN